VVHVNLARLQVGRAGQGRAGQGRAGQGRAGQGAGGVEGRRRRRRDFLPGMFVCLLVEFLYLLLSSNHMKKMPRLPNPLESAALLKPLPLPPPLPLPLPLPLKGQGAPDPFHPLLINPWARGLHCFCA
jgi:hypothetical protein